MAKWKRDAKREAFWRAALAHQREGGLGVRAFCRREKLSEPSFYAWRRILLQRDAQRQPKPKQTRARVPFVPVVLREAPRPLEGTIVIELCAGRRLHLPADVAPDRLAALVHALEAARPAFGSEAQARREPAEGSLVPEARP